jgi:translation elongation factor EF-Ts
VVVRRKEMTTESMVLSEIETIKKLRKETSAPLAICKEAVQKLGTHDFDNLLQYIKNFSGYSVKSKENANRCYVIRSYVHHTNQLGVLVRISVDTDFAAKSQEVIDFTDGLAMTIAANNPTDFSVKIPWVMDENFTVEQQKNKLEAQIKESIQIHDWHFMRS